MKLTRKQLRKLIMEAWPGPGPVGYSPDSPALADDEPHEEEDTPYYDKPHPSRSLGRSLTPAEDAIYHLDMARYAGKTLTLKQLVGKLVTPWTPPHEIDQVKKEITDELVYGYKMLIAIPGIPPKAFKDILSTAYIGPGQDEAEVRNAYGRKVLMKVITGNYTLTVAEFEGPVTASR